MAAPYSQSNTVHGTTQTFFGTLADYQGYAARNLPVRPGTVVMDASTTPATFLGISDGAGGLSGGAADGNSVVIVDPMAAPWNITQNTPDATATIQAIINILHANVVSQIQAGLSGYGIVALNGTFNVSSLVVPGTVSLIGRSSSDCGFVQIPGTVGDVLTVTAYQGLVGGIRRQQYFTGFRIDGNVQGIQKLTLSTDGSTAVVTNVTGASATFPGYIIEAVGIPKNDVSGAQGLVTVVSQAGNQITITTPTVGANGPLNKAISRQCVTTTCTADGTTATMLCSNTAGIQVGMKTYGANLQTDSDDLNQWSVVTAVSPNFSVTLDRPTMTAGLFACQFYVAPGGIRLVEETFAPNYQSNKNYEAITFYDVHITQMAYYGCVNRGRAQFHSINSKFDACYGYGFIQTGASDTYFEDHICGSCFWSAMQVASSATPRWHGEYYDTYLSDRYYEVQVRSCREWHMYNSDINGRVFVRNSQNTTNGIGYIEGCNFKYQIATQLAYKPGLTSSAYVTSSGPGTVLNVIGGGFKGDDNGNPSSQGRPDYITSSIQGGLINLSGMAWSDFPTSGVDKCPYNIAITDTPGSTSMQYVQVSQSGNTGRLIQQEGNWSSAVVVGFVTPGSAVFTPVVANYATWSLSNGYGTIRVQINGTLTTTGASGNFQITGCPLMPNSADGIKPLLMAQSKSTGLTWGTSCTQLNGRMNLGGGITLEGSGTGVAGGTLNVAQFTSGATQVIEVTGTFKV